MATREKTSFQFLLFQLSGIGTVATASAFQAEITVGSSPTYRSMDVSVQRGLFPILRDSDIRELPGSFQKSGQYGPVF